MASVQTGVATIFGFSGTPTGISGAVTFFNESGEISSDIKIDEIRDEDNELRGLIHSGEVLDATLMFTPFGVAATGIAALGAAIVAPTKGATITLASFKATVLNGTTWVYVGGWKMSFKKDGVATYELKVKKGISYAINTAVAS